MSKSIDGTTKLFGLIGEDIAYTKSPALHNRAAELLGVAAAYLPLPMPSSEVKKFLDVAWTMGAIGFNVTKPHKTLVAGLFPEAKLASVNTLYRGPQGWLAASTDGEGFALAAARLGKPLDDYERLVVLGAGGATSAIVSRAAKSRNLKSVVVLSRSSASHFRSSLPDAIEFSCEPFETAALSEALGRSGEETLLIQATSAPHSGDDLSAFVPALQRFSGNVCDIVYGKPSAIYFAALGKDLNAQDGEAMLIEQARLSQMLWWGRSASYDDMVAALRGKASSSS